MEAFTFLKYWRGGGGGGGGPPSSHTTTSPTTTLTAAPPPQHLNTSTESDEDEDADGGSFFDLVFAVDDSQVGNHQNPINSNPQQEKEEEDENIEESESEFKFSLSPLSNDRSDPNLSLSPSEELFFKGKLVQVEPNSSEPNSTNKPQFSASLLKSATKLRVFMSGLKKSKTNIASEKESNGSDSVTPNSNEPDSDQQPESQKKQTERKLFTVKFKVEEVPIMSLFTRENSSRGNNNNNKSHSQKQSTEKSPSSADEKRSSKEVVDKYLKMVKPLYIRVSRRYGEKLGFSGQLNMMNSGGKSAPPHAATEKKPSPAKAVVETETDNNTFAEIVGTNAKNRKIEKQGNLQARLRVVCKHLGKSRSASSVAAPPAALLSSKRRDDSLLQQHDGIQSAILHCKRSFNASRSVGESSQLPRPVSDALHETSLESSTKSVNEGEDTRL